MSMETELAELDELADQILLDDDPVALAAHTACCLRELNRRAGFSTRITAMATTLAKYFEKYADANE